VSEGIAAAARALRESLVDFEPELLSGADCAALAEELALTEKVCAAARARAGLRAADCGAHRQRGFADAATWLARSLGSSAGQARAALDTAGALHKLPSTKAALAAGELSLSQAAEIAKTEAARPGSEQQLLALARSHSLRALKEAARRRRLGSIDPEELHRRQHQAQELRHWRDELGMICFSGALAPEAGLAFLSRLEAETDRVFRQGGPEVRAWSRRRRAAEAFVHLVEGGGGPQARRADLVVVCDLRAYRRGQAQDDEPCHLVGGGPIPVSLARRLGADAFLKAVLHDGVAIHTVAHFGRHIPVTLRTALELGAPPDFDGVSCAGAGCERRHGLEWDHVDPVAHNGPTSFANLEARCCACHREKTEADRAAGLLGGTGDGHDPPGEGPPESPEGGPRPSPQAGPSAA